MTDMELKLRTILNEKNEKLTPNTIKAEVQIFNVTGVFDGTLESDTDYNTCLKLTEDILR